MTSSEITDPDLCGKKCDSSENCYGGWFNGETLECWNMFEQFERHKRKYIYQADSKTGVFIKTGTLNSVYSTAYQCSQEMRCNKYFSENDIEYNIYKDYGLKKLDNYLTKYQKNSLSDC